MQTVVQHSIYGTITYTENFWTGRKEIYFGQVPLVHKGKNTFVFPSGETEICVNVKGNSLYGVTLAVGNETIRIMAPPKWYEICLSSLALVFLCVWGNSVALCSIFPVVGGAIGGAIGGLGMAFSLLFMRQAKRLSHKLLIWLGIFVATVLLSYVVALLILGFMA